MNVVKRWFVCNQDAITWFIIGWMTFSGFIDLGAHNYVTAVFDFVIVYANYKLAGVRLQ